MRNKVDKIKAEVEGSELFMISEVDLAKIYTVRSIFSIYSQATTLNPQTKAART